MSWSSARLGDLADEVPSAVAIGPFGSSLTADLYRDVGMRVVRGQDIGPGVALEFKDPVFVGAETVARLRRSVVESGDLIFPHRGAIGRVGMVGSESLMMSTSMMKITLDRSKCDPNFYLYYMRGPGKRALLEHASVVGTPGIAQPLTALRSITVPVPPLPTQRAIAEVLGALDDKIAANSATAAAASLLADSLYARASTGVARVAASSTLTPVLGGTPDRGRAEYWVGEVPWVSARDITGASEGVILNTEESISHDAVARSRAKPVPAGSVILTARGTVGAVARLGVDSAFNQSCYAFVPSRGLPAGCLYFMVKDAATDALSVAHGSVFSTITMRSFDALTVPDFGGDALARLEAELRPLLELVAAMATESRHLATLRDTLLPHLMSGRLTVRDAEARVEAAL